MNKRKLESFAVLGAIGSLALLLIGGSGLAYAGQPENTAKSHTISTVSSTIPGNGDINPYGIFQVPSSVGRLNGGSILISNFNSGANLQGTGTTLVQIAPDGTFSLFAQIDPNSLPGPCPGGVGLTTALVVLRSGWVVVGSLPTTDGTSATAQAGCLLVLDSNGNVVETITDALINGPWDMTVFDGPGDDDAHNQSAADSQPSQGATLFVTNVLNGTVAGGGLIVNQGTVLRIGLAVSASSPPSVKSLTVMSLSSSY